MAASVCQQLRAKLLLCRTEKGWWSFSNVGLDCFVPISGRNGRTWEQMYGCLLTCLRLCEVHLEVAPKLDNNLFIISLMRSVRGRGTPWKVPNDSGTGFVGGVLEFKDIIIWFDQKKIMDCLLAREISCHSSQFTSPSWCLGAHDPICPETFGSTKERSGCRLRSLRFLSCWSRIYLERQTANINVLRRKWPTATDAEQLISV